MAAKINAIIGRYVHLTLVAPHRIYFEAGGRFHYFVTHRGTDSRRFAT